MRFLSLSIFNLSLSFPLTLPPIFPAISSESRCFVSPLQAEKYIAAIWSYYHCYPLRLSVRHRVTQAFTFIYLHISVSKFDFLRVSLLRYFFNLPFSRPFHLTAIVCLPQRPK